MAGTVLHAEAVIVEHHKQKAGDPDRNLRIYEKQLHAGAVLTPREQYYYARELYYHHRYEEAAAAFQTFLSPCRTAGWKIGWMHILYSHFVWKLVEKEGWRCKCCCRVWQKRRRVPGFAVKLGGTFFSRENMLQLSSGMRALLIAMLRLRAVRFSILDHIGYTPYMQLCVCYYAWAILLQRGSATCRLQK